MTIICQAEYEELKQCFEQHEDKLSPHEVELFKQIIAAGEGGCVPDGWAIQCRGAQHRIYLERHKAGLHEKAPYIIRIQFGGS